MNERKGFSIAGIPFVGLCVPVAIVGLVLLLSRGPYASLGILLEVLGIFLIKGFFQVAPNTGQVMQLFGKYAGTVRDEGLRWTNPFYAKRLVSLRVRNFESGKLKVNDSDGNPIEIAAVVVWQVVDTAEAVFCVEDYENYVHIQSESALRQMAQSYPYDAHDNGQPSLRSHGDDINTHLRDEIQARLGKAGVEVTEARISHLAYAQEIAQAMLQRQQASAIIAARTRIVEGAVGMVGMALEELRKQGVVELDEERKAAMVSNLLVVLCGERGTQPVLNTGTLYN
ncbi:SPFH domain-containing protein [Rhodanobacter sp. DHG33]|uniref:SPFH domain-containing protein n=1 Tax=Rhodanobacter sp. DHG33 TaxID=2775921 RepID=UPI001783DA38|nr:SPFH domain-containing protein [Rhodanobacter sp. DHG33]MBD8900152.1 SPFH domain-containing protein [Rhodanobacter sp. DHG33]